LGEYFICKNGDFTMTTLILVRHGESEANRNDVFAGQINPDLQNKGLKQAELTAEYISKNYNVDKIYSSDLKRAFRTAECLGRLLNLEVVIDKSFREIDAGDWENVKFNDLPILFPKEFYLWVNDIGIAVCPNGESVKQVSERVMLALTKIAEENTEKTVVIATHATPIRVAQSMIQTGGLDEMKNIPWVSNASVSVFEYENNKFKAVKISEDAHLAELKTALPDNV